MGVGDDSVTLFICRSGEACRYTVRRLGLFGEIVKCADPYGCQSHEQERCLEEGKKAASFRASSRRVRRIPPVLDTHCEDAGEVNLEDYPLMRCERRQ